jgi:pyroglutamyl-peptidase
MLFHPHRSRKTKRVPPEKKKGPVLLVTAFEPFDGAKTNSSLILLEKLKAQDWEGRVVFFGPVPVSFEDAWPLILQEIERHPDLQGVIAMGQAEGSTRISLERMALNWIDARSPDNYGVAPRRCAVEAGAARILKAGFPWHELEESPNWECTYYAGSYVCNAVMYQALNWAREQDKTAGFVHIPLLASQKGDPALGENSPRMDDDLAAKSLSRIIAFSLEKLEAKPEITPAARMTPRQPDGPHAA